jgi:hypothetical protein
MGRFDLFLDKNNAWKRFNSLWKDPNIRTLVTKNKRIAILSDMHLGNGGDADDFHTPRRSTNWKMRRKKAG